MDNNPCAKGQDKRVLVREEGTVMTALIVAMAFILVLIIIEVHILKRITVDRDRYTEDVVRPRSETERKSKDNKRISNNN